MDNTLYALLNGKIGKFETMPSASADFMGKIIQYIGETSGAFTSGYFYKCTQSGSTYEWTRINVQPGGGGGTGDFDELTNKPKYNGTDMSHSTDIPEVKTQTWNNKYDKPDDGIPKTDLASDVQASLSKADSALQTHSTAEQVQYDSTLETHTSGSVGEQLSTHSEQIVTLQQCGLTVVNGELNMTYEEA